MYRLRPPKFRSRGRCRCPVIWHLHLFCIYSHLFTYNRIYRVPNVPSFCARPEVNSCSFYPSILHIFCCYSYFIQKTNRQLLEVRSALYRPVNADTSWSEFYKVCPELIRGHAIASRIREPYDPPRGFRLYFDPPRRSAPPWGLGQAPTDIGYVLPKFRSRVPTP